MTVSAGKKSSVTVRYYKTLKTTLNRWSQRIIAELDAWHSSRYTDCMDQKLPGRSRRSPESRRHKYFCCCRRVSQKKKTMSTAQDTTNTTPLPTSPIRKKKRQRQAAVCDSPPTIPEEKSDSAQVYYAGKLYDCPPNHRLSISRSAGKTVTVTGVVERIQTVYGIGYLVPEHCKFVLIRKKQKPPKETINLTLV